MRIILITSKLNFEHAAGAVVDLDLKARGLKALGHKVTVVTTFSQDNRKIEQASYRVKQEYILKPGLWFRQKGIFRILKKYESQADIFYVDAHIFLYGAGLYRLLGGKTPVLGFFNVKLTPWTYDRDLNPVSFFTKCKRVVRYWLEKTIGMRMARGMDTLVFNTPMVADLYCKFGLQYSKRHVVPDFADTKAIMEHNNWNRSSLRAHHAKKPIVIYCSGRLIPSKGFDIIINALTHVSDKSSVKLIIGGDGPDEPRLRQLAESMGLGSSIHFPGWLEKQVMLRTAKEAHIFVLPNWWIEYGSALLHEMLATGLPCIVPGGGGLQWVSDGSSVYFKQNDSASLADALYTMIQDAELRVRVAEKSLARAKQLEYFILAQQLAKIMKKAVRYS